MRNVRYAMPPGAHVTQTRAFLDKVNGLDYQDSIADIKSNYIAQPAIEGRSV